MRLATAQINGEVVAVMMDGDTFIEVDLVPGKFDPEDPLMTWLRLGASSAGLVPAAEKTRHHLVKDLQLSAPIRRPGKIIAVGLNYADHVSETGLVVSAEPLTFAKYPSSIVGPNAEILVPTGTNSEPRYCAEWIKDIYRNQFKVLGVDAPELMSGPFHDALALSYACDYGMIFIRSKDGISHNPLEYSSYEDLALGTEILYGSVLEILNK